MELVIAACTAAACGFSIDTWHEVATQYPLCATEDSADCVWRADVQGNGSGKSFIAIDNGDSVSVVYEPIDGILETVTFTK